MSFDIFLQCYRNGEAASFKRAVFDEIFETQNDRIERDFVQPRYSDGSGGDIYVDENDVQCIMFNHCGGDIFWAKVCELLYVTKSVIFWPDDKGHNSVIANTDALKHLPSTWVEDFGEVNIAHNGPELEAFIYS
ncbi:MAG TPA: hypothetical protein VJR47_10820 [Stellaceae bacterium]|nr:hypothetical protein [Stellaceae bacterium]